MAQQARKQAPALPIGASEWAATEQLMTQLMAAHDALRRHVDELSPDVADSLTDLADGLEREDLWGEAGRASIPPFANTLSKLGRFPRFDTAQDRLIRARPSRCWPKASKRVDRKKRGQDGFLPSGRHPVREILSGF